MNLKFARKKKCLLVTDMFPILLANLNGLCIPYITLKSSILMWERITENEGSESLQQILQC